MIEPGTEPNVGNHLRSMWAFGHVLEKDVKDAACRK